MYSAFPFPILYTYTFFKLHFQRVFQTIGQETIRNAKIASLMCKHILFNILKTMDE